MSTRRCDETPRCDRLLACINEAERDLGVGVSVFKDYFKNWCFPPDGELLQFDRQGRWQERPLSREAKMEQMLTVAFERRNRWIESKSTATNLLAHDTWLSEDDYKCLYNLWRSDKESWMNPEQLAKLNTDSQGKSNNDIRKLTHSRFRAMQHQVFGTSELMKKLIQLPVSSITEWGCFNSDPSAVLFHLVHALKSETIMQLSLIHI